ncbi:MAG TPA: APC family permease [Candidatus Babeliales bacterium]|nr:APC family permease [Candidatus Babeliales bacterium]
MQQERTLSLPIAILININTMLGSGIFLNTTILAERAGAVGFVSYAVIGILLLPLVISMAHLLNIHPAGGFYTFAKCELSLFAGFISAWSYFTAKLASATLMIHASVITLQQLIPALAQLHPFILDSSILACFIGLNMFNMRTGGRIQTIFTVLKMIPIIFAICAGLYLFTGSNFTETHLLWVGIPGTIPLVIYATMGFETACSLSNHIKNAHKNGPLAILISYALAIGIIIAYQFLMYGALGTSLLSYATFRDAFPGLASLLTPASATTAQTIGGLLNLAIAASILGGSYGILFSNVWNLHTLATHNHVFFSSLFTALNKNAIPSACVLAEGALCIMYLFISGGQIVVLQQIGALGVVFTYTMSVLSLVYAKRARPSITIPLWIPALGLFNCLLLIAACIRGLLLSGFVALMYFVSLLVCGIVMFLYTQKTMREEPQGF